MRTIALLPRDPLVRGRYLDRQDLPVNYMADFSLLGLVVNRFREAVTLLRSAGYRLELVGETAEVQLDGARQLPAIKTLLAAGKIDCELADIADSLYQA